MPLRNVPIRRKLMSMILLTCGLVLLLNCVAFLTAEYLTFRQSSARHLATLAQVIASNSTAALAFENPADAREILSALRAEPHVVAATLYDRHGQPFAHYPDSLGGQAAPEHPGVDGYRFQHGHLTGFQPVVQGDNARLGTLFLEDDLGAMYQRLSLYALIAAAASLFCLMVAYLLSRALQGQISVPILGLAGVAHAVSERRDYSVRATRIGRDEIGTLTDAFNDMLSQIEKQNGALQESESRNRAIVDSSLDAIIAIDHEGTIVGFNSAAERILGYPAADVLGRNLVHTIVPPALREQVLDDLGRDPAAGGDLRLGRRVELEAIRANGTSISMEVSIARMPGAGPAMFTWFLRDITEQKQAEQKQRVQLARHDLLNRITRAIGERQDLPSIFQVVVTTLEDNLPLDFGCICLYDAAAESLAVTALGLKAYPIAEQLDMGENGRIAIDRNGLSRCIRGQLVYEPDVSALDFPFPKRLARGGLRSLTAAPLLLESHVFGVLLAARKEPDSFTSLDCEFLRQLSEHVALAAHQAQTHTALQQAYNDLRQSQQAVMQQERLRALGQMASGIAHDINNAISPIALYTQSLLESEPNLSTRAREYLETIERAIEDVAATVARMREFYRPREPQLELTPADVNGLVKQVMHLTRAWRSDMPQQRGVVIETRLELAADAPAIMAAESEVREALTNLIFNAVDSMPQGGVLTVRTRVTNTAAAPGVIAAVRQVQVEVSDTGVGMNEETRRRCLEPFFTTKGERGTGLGLAMVYGMVQRHSAELDIESAPGVGTTVRLTFAAPASTIVGDEVLHVPTVLPRMRLLIVDDDPLLIKSLRDTLELDGHLIVTASGGQEGIDTFRASLQGNERFAAVITDLGMPYVDGRQVAAEVKRASATTPVILLTGWGQRLAADGDIPPHVDQLLSKPPKLRELRESLLHLIGR